MENNVFVMLIMLEKLITIVKKPSLLTVGTPTQPVANNRYYGKL